MWFITGFEHIANWQGYDHILFLLALCVAYTPQQWKSLLVLITAFTIGHSLTLALSVLNVIQVNTQLVELLIPLTILLTCIYNLSHRKKGIEGNFKANYWMVLFFGLIHGLGFSTLLKSLLGNQTSILSPLFAFNVGLEAGQLVIVAAILIFSVALSSIFRMKRSNVNFFVSAAVFGISFVMALQRFFELIKNT